MSDKLRSLETAIDLLRSAKALLQAADSYRESGEHADDVEQKAIRKLTEVSELVRSVQGDVSCQAVS